jgi:L-lactate dehydrogenase complex protein LldE
MAHAATVKFAAGDSVALFVPCFVDVFYPEVGKATVALFERLGIPVTYPEDQTCCGQPAFSAGHWGHAASLAAHFAQVFSQHRWIVAPSGSCVAMVRDSFGQLGLDPEASAIGARTFDLATFLVDVVGVVDVGARFPHAVTYHDGCHGRRILRNTDSAIALLRAVRDLEYRELADIEECCGFGGFFSIDYDELSASMGTAKCERATATGARYLVSGDASCLMHVGGMLAKKQSTLQTIHLAQVLAGT